MNRYDVFSIYFIATNIGQPSDLMMGTVSSAFKYSDFDFKVDFVEYISISNCFLF